MRVPHVGASIHLDQIHFVLASTKVSVGVLGIRTDFRVAHAFVQVVVKQVIIREVGVGGEPLHEAHALHVLHRV